MTGRLPLFPQLPGVASPRLCGATEFHWLVERVGGSAGFADRDTTEGIDTLLRRPAAASGLTGCPGRRHLQLLRINLAYCQQRFQPQNGLRNRFTGLARLGGQIRQMGRRLARCSRAWNATTKHSISSSPPGKPQPRDTVFHDTPVLSSVTTGQFCSCSPLRNTTSSPSVVPQSTGVVVRWSALLAERDILHVMAPTYHRTAQSASYPFH